MIFKFKTWRKPRGNQGAMRFFITLRFETDNYDFYNRIQSAIENALPVPKDEKEQKPDVMGFHAPGDD